MSSKYEQPISILQEQANAAFIYRKHLKIEFGEFLRTTSASELKLEQLEWWNNRLKLAFQQEALAEARLKAPAELRLELARQFHYGPLKADDHDFDPDSPQGKWALEVADFFIARD